MPRSTSCARSVTCWWRYRALEHGQKAACPRCGTTLTVAWDAPRQRPTAYALAALFMLLLSNLFPFVNMNVAGVTSEITLLEIPGVLFSEDYASLGTFFLLFVQLVPAFCLITILLLVNRAELPVRLKEQLARVLFQLKTWEWRRFSSLVCWSVSLN